MEKEGFSITNIDIIGKAPCCDLLFVQDGQILFKREKISFEDIRELLAGNMANCESVLRQLDSFKSKKEKWI